MHWLRFLSTLLTLCFSFGCSIPHINVYKDPLTAEEHYKLAMTYEQEGEYEAAVREYKAASKSIAEAYYYLGNIYFTLGEYEKAEKNYKIAIRKLPKNPRPYNNLAWLYFTQARNWNEAESLASQAVELVAEEESAPYRDTLDKIRQALDKERSGPVRLPLETSP
jgi:tetratricopeptide (TPR) repeat protein